MQKRWSAKKKTELILLILRGEDIETVSRENNIGMSELIEWRDQFIESGMKGLQKNTDTNPEIVEYQKLLAKTQVELEILKKKHGIRIQ
jgi:transposase-like protein